MPKTELVVGKFKVTKTNKRFLIEHTEIPEGRFRAGYCDLQTAFTRYRDGLYFSVFSRAEKQHQALRRVYKDLATVTSWLGCPKEIPETLESTLELHTTDGGRCTVLVKAIRLYLTKEIQREYTVATLPDTNAVVTKRVLIDFRSETQCPLTKLEVVDRLSIPDIDFEFHYKTEPKDATV